MDDYGYIAECLPSGEWDEIAGCEMIFCNELYIDDATVVQTDIKNMHTMTTHASKMKLSCKEPLHDFDFSENIVRLFLTCGKT